MEDQEQQEPVNEQAPQVSKRERFTRVWRKTRSLAILGWRAGLRGIARGRELAVRGWRSERSQALRSFVRARAVRVKSWLKEHWPLARRALGYGARVALLVGLTVLGVIGFGRSSLHTVEPGEIGVRASKWSGEGVAAQDFGPGLHLSLPGVHKWYSLPAGSELLTWRKNGKAGTQTPLDVRTQDGTSITLSLTVPYKVRPESAHRIVSEGHRNTYRAQALAKTEQVLLNEFGRLSTEEFSRSAVRREMLDKALALLNTSLAEIHVEAEEILIDELRFSDAYEKKLVETQRERQRGRVLEARQLEDQEQQTILRRRHEIDQELLTRRIELDREIERIRGDGQALAVESAQRVAKLESEIRADADREYELLVAQGEAELLKAQELEKRLHADILTGEGGDEYLALQAVRATRLQKVTLNSNDSRVPNPLDVESMVGLFVAED